MANPPFEGGRLVLPNLPFGNAQEAHGALNTQVIDPALLSDDPNAAVDDLVAADSGLVRDAPSQTTDLPLPFMGQITSSTRSKRGHSEDGSQAAWTTKRKRTEDTAQDKDEVPTVTQDPLELIERYGDKLDGERLLWVLSKYGGRKTLSELCRLVRGVRRGNGARILPGLENENVEKSEDKDGVTMPVRSTFSKRKRAALCKRATRLNIENSKVFDEFEQEAWHGQEDSRPHKCRKDDGKKGDQPKVEGCRETRQDRDASQLRKLMPLPSALATETQISRVISQDSPDLYTQGTPDADKQELQDVDIQETPNVVVPQESDQDLPRGSRADVSSDSSSTGFLSSDEDTLQDLEEGRCYEPLWSR